MITFFQPPGFTDAFFDEQINLVDIELAKLKELLEKASWELTNPGLGDGYCIGETYEGTMSHDFEARPANISTGANAAERLYTSSLIPQTARLSSISSSTRGW